MPQSLSKFKLVSTCEEMSRWSDEERASGKTIGFVPTMGALHDGHLSLVKRCQQMTDLTVVSIYVNPTQFAPGEDLSKYPRPIERDLELLQELNVALVFTPSDAEMYPKKTAGSETAYGGTLIQAPKVGLALEGERRPSHFQGVATIVLKLFNVVRPNIAFFGQKDFQQTLVVRQMVKDLNLPVEIDVCPIVREKSGLAMSSRNVYLSSSEKSQALALSNCLLQAKEMIEHGEKSRIVVEGKMRDVLESAGVQEVDYTTVANAVTLEQPETIELPVVCLVAAHVGKTRLIDNMLIEK